MTNETIDARLFPGYEIGKKLGEGGGGCVYEAFHKNLRKKVVIKKLKYGFSDEAKKRTEVDIMKNLHHTYIPSVIDYFEKDNIAYTVMDYVEGKSFGQLLKEGRKFTEKQVLKYYEQLCEVVSYLHSQSIPVIHGDIKPDNLMLTPEDQICLIDFNISGISKDGHAYTDGYTAGYSAPEQYTQFKQIIEKRKSAMQSASGPNGGSSTPDNRAYTNRTELIVDDETEAIITETEGLFDISIEETELMGEEDKTEFFADTDSLGIGETVCIFDDETSELLVVNKSNRSVNKVVSSALKVNQDNAGPVELILIDKRSDVYSIAATMFHLLTGKKYSAEKNYLLNSGMSDGLIYILNKALSFSPDSRYRDAGEMLLAIKNIYKSDKKYKKLVFMENVIRLLFIVMVLGGALLIYMGNQKLQLEYKDLYASYVENMYDAILAGDEEAVNENYQLAIERDNCKIDAYYYRMLFYYDMMNYEQVITYAEEVLTTPEINSQEMLQDIDYLVGKSFLELEQYENAHDYFSRAIGIDKLNVSYFVSDAIALARNGKAKEAKDRLAQAVDIGIDDADSTLIDAEIAYSTGDYENAILKFQSCLKMTKDDYSKLSAYIMISKSYDKLDGTKSNYDKNLELLTDAITDLPMEYHEMILQRTAQVAINAATKFADSGYEQKAIAALEESVRNGNTAFTNYNNLEMLYQRINQFDKASQCVEEMMLLYPNDYRVFKRAAFLELDVQMNREEDSRNYEKFVEYYQTTKSLYEKAKEMTDTADMQKLEQAYNDLLNGGWL